MVDRVCKERQALDEDSVLQALDEEWNAAIVKNDAEAIGRFMLEDWVIIGPDGNQIDRATFLAVDQIGRPGSRVDGLR